MRAARFCSFCNFCRERFPAISPANTTVIEMGLYQGIADVSISGETKGLIRFMAPMPEAMFLDGLSI